MLRVTDESMHHSDTQGGFRLNDAIYIDPDAAGKDGDVVVFRWKGRTHLRRYRNVDGQIVFETINPQWPHPRFEAEPDMRIVGVVIYGKAQAPELW